MQKLKFKFFLLILGASVNLNALYSEEVCDDCRGRVDAGAVFVSIDMLESGHTVRTLELWGGKADATILIWKGLCLKPSFLVATGKANLNTAALGLGFCIPMMNCLVLTPSIGVNETHYNSNLDFPDFYQFNVREKFQSQGVYGSIELSYKFWEKWRLIGQYQYAFSRVHTKLSLQVPFAEKPYISSHDNCSGPSFGVQLERDMTDSLTITIGAGYNSSLSREKHGLRGKGLKLALGYWF